MENYTPKSRPRVAFAMRSNQLRDSLISPQAMERLREIAEVVDEGVLTEFDSQHAQEVLATTTALITSWGSPPIDAVVLKKAPSLALIAHAAGSVKAHVGQESWDRGIRVTTAAQGNAVPVAEFTLAHILLAGKHSLAKQEEFRQQRSSFRKDALEVTMGNAAGTVGIIGASRIGRLVCELLRPFNLEILISDPTISAAEATELGAELVGLAELMSRSRVASLHAPILPSTLKMIGAAQLALLPDGATFINTARGVLVDHDALRSELVSGRISAILDVTDPEPLPDDDVLYELPNVVLTPHIAGSVGNELHRLGDLAVDEVEFLAAGKAPGYAISAEVLLAMA